MSFNSVEGYVPPYRGFREENGLVIISEAGRWYPFIFTSLTRNSKEEIVTGKGRWNFVFHRPKGLEVIILYGEEKYPRYPSPIPITRRPPRGLIHPHFSG